MERREVVFPEPVPILGILKQGGDCASDDFCRAPPTIRTFPAVSHKICLAGAHRTFDRIRLTGEFHPRGTSAASRDRLRSHLEIVPHAPNSRLEPNQGFQQPTVVVRSDFPGQRDRARLIGGHVHTIRP